MAFEMLVGLDVGDEQGYGEYRKAMTPILRRYGGGFRYDFRVSETLKAEVDHAINRVFTLFFEDESARDRFFSDPDYKMAREKYFATSVNAAVIIAEYRTGRAAGTGPAGP